MSFVCSTVEFLCSVNANRDEAENASNDFSCILSRDALIVQQNHICSVVGVPTTIIQFHKLSDGNWDRIDSHLSSISLRSSCHTLRACAKGGEELCKKCDSLHADLFFGLSEENFEEMLRDKLENRIGFLRKEYTDPNYSPRIERKAERYYLAYNCPMLGYKEHIFPIFYQNSIIGVLFLGQIKLKTPKDIDAIRIRETKERFFRNNENIFDEYVKYYKPKIRSKSNKKYSPESIRKYILTNSNRSLRPWYEPLHVKTQDMHNPRIQDKMSPSKYNEMLEKVCERLSVFEAYLVERMVYKQTEFIHNTILTSEDAFRQLDLLTTYDDLYSLWKNVEQFLKSIAIKCGVHSINVFSSNSVSQKDDKYVRLVAKYNNNEKRDHTKNVRAKQCITKPLDNIPNKPIDSEDSKELFSLLPEGFHENSEKTLALLLPAQRLPSASILLLLDFESSNAKKQIGKLLSASLINFFVLITSRLSELFENATQIYLDRVLRMYKHEINHLASGMARPLSYLVRNDLFKIDPRKLSDVYKDAEGTLSMLSFMEDNIETLLNKRINPIFEYFPISQKLLYKWENIFREDAHKKQVEFFFRPSKLQIYSDPRYVELVIYNLFSNSVKYSFDGTKIYFDCKPDYSGSNRHILSIVNYSSFIPEEKLNDLFSFGYRYENSGKDDYGGSGIGLFVVAQVLEQLGGTIEIKKPRLISRYCVPMLHAYIMSFASDAEKKTDRYSSGMKAYRRLQNMKIDDLFDKNVNALDLVLSDSFRWNTDHLDINDVLDQLDEGTYEIRFEVMFP